MRRLGQVGGNYLLGRREGKGARNRVAGARDASSDSEDGPSSRGIARDGWTSGVAYSLESQGRKEGCGDESKVEAGQGERCAAASRCDGHAGGGKGS